MDTKRGNSGFSLMELSIALLIIGLIVTPLVAAYNIYIYDYKKNETRGTLTEIRDTINLYIQANGRYPLPARLDLTEGAANFGTEGSPNPALCSGAGWYTADGMCSTDGTPSAVLIGAVPVDILGLGSNKTLDYWGNKILYAVSKPQTDALTYSSSGARVVLQHLDLGTPRSAVTLPDLYDMVLVSFGETGKGAYTDATVLVSPCVGAVAENEDENCDFDNVFLLDKDPDDVLNNSTASHVSDGTFYDDLTLDQQEFPRDHWYQHDPDPSFVISQANRVGIGTTDPQARLHVVGNVQADEILTDSICDEDLTGCFDPEIIAGDVPEMDCNANSVPGIEPVLSIGNSQVECASAVDAGGNPVDGRAFVFDNSHFNWVNCGAAGQLMTGIDASGSPICVTP